MEGPSNGGMLYHEVQESKLCAVHCVNTVLQGPFFSEFDLAALASDLDQTESQMMLEGTGGGDFVTGESHNVSMDGDFSIQVLEKALEVWDLQVIPLNCPVAEPAQVDPELENAFICHLQDHWFCIRKVNGEWYNFDSLYAAPEHLSKFYLSAYLDTLKGFGWSIFLVRGNFPKECPMTSSEASNGYGQWLLPEDAERIIKSCNSVQRQPHRTVQGRLPSDPFLQPHRTFSDAEDEDLKAAIAASLLDSSPAIVNAEAGTSENETKNSSGEKEDKIGSEDKEKSNKSEEDVHKNKSEENIDCSTDRELFMRFLEEDLESLMNSIAINEVVLVGGEASWLIFILRQNSCRCDVVEKKKPDIGDTSGDSGCLGVVERMERHNNVTNPIMVFHERPAPPLPHLHLSEEMVSEVAALMRDHINALLSVSQDIATGKDPRMFFKLAAYLSLISVVGGLTDFLTLGYTSLVIVLTLPAIYERYEDHIDRYLLEGYRKLQQLYVRLDVEYRFRTVAGRRRG
ncbi:hypothetical protein RJ639_036077 [Escallonia herrerae]|uniref:Reticulon-like protein n=1 Tax=Escallonia herrerae TaxID=1293975 RepID=A0AA88WRJ4_9ASTE|nr:hypothetical protein RJ639_036077 [Escallonia herrerae]